MIHATVEAEAPAPPTRAPVPPSVDPWLVAAVLAFAVSVGCIVGVLACLLGGG